MRRLLLLILTAACCASSSAGPAESPASPPPSALADLEARAPKENRPSDATLEFQQAVVRLVESNTLTSSDDFFRAAMLVSQPIVEYRAARMQYELLLAAAAKNHRGAEQALPASWDALLERLGRPMRVDAFGFAAANSGNEAFALDPAPAVIQAVLRHPAAARDAAGKATDNIEVQTIVDADQAVRANWSKLTEEESKSVSANDRLRNRRIREIVTEGGLSTAKDFANASLVMQHSSGFAGFELAHELAVCSMLLGDRGMGRWLVAATYDRMLDSVGHDQRFGTQGAITFSGQVSPGLRPVDETGIGDAERLALGCPTLATKRGDGLVGAAWTRIEQGRFAEAEVFARAAVGQHTTAYPGGEWPIFRSRRALGVSLAGQKRFAEAEPFLVGAYEALSASETKLALDVRAKLRDIAESLVQLHEATHQPQKAGEWKQRIEDFDRAAAR